MSSTSNVPASPAGPQSGWTAGRVIAMVFGSIGGLIGVALLVGGIAVVVAYAIGRDDDGYFNTDRKELKSTTYAVTTEEINLGADELDWAPDKILGNVRLQVDSERPVFVGIGPQEAVGRYLAGVSHDELVDFNRDQPEFDRHGGGAPRTPPQEQGFWVARSEGTGEQPVTWDAQFGRWAVVVMNANGSRGIDIEAKAGVKVNWVIWAGLGMLIVGLLMTVGAVFVILIVGRRASP